MPLHLPFYPRRYYDNDERQLSRPASRSNSRIEEVGQCLLTWCAAVCQPKCKQTWD